MQEIEDEIVDEFSQFEDQMDKYEYIIDQGRLLAPLDAQYMTDDFMVKGCQSKVWLRAYKDGERMMIQVDSNTAQRIPMTPVPARPCACKRESDPSDWFR